MALLLTEDAEVQFTLGGGGDVEIAVTEDGTLALEYRVNGITAASSAALETLATAGGAAFEGITSNASFSFLQIIDSSDEYAFDGSVRTLTRTYTLKVLTT